MRNFKKVLSLVLAVIMVMSTLTVSMAAEATTSEEKAAVLYVLGLFDGKDADEYMPALLDGATREEAMKLIAVAFGWEIDMDAVSIFTDVSDWAQPYVKVAYEMGVTEGYDPDAGIFGGSDPVSPRQIATFFDRMLTGSETAWEDNAGLSEDDATRGEMVDAMWDALMSTKTGEEAPLIDAIIADVMADAPTRTVEGVEGATIEEVATMSGLYVAPTIQIMTISAVNKTTIKVDFDQAVDAIAVENVSASVAGEAMTVETAVLAPGGASATITVNGLNYGDEVTIMLTGLEVGGVALEDVTAELTVPALNDLYELSIDSDAADDTIKSDGATKTMLTASLIEKATGDVVPLDGVVDFSATKGGLAQSEVTLEDGVANVQLTSAASDASITSYITVIIVDAPSATEYEGVTGQFEVYFTPDAVDDASTTFVQAASAESNQADRLFVTYTGDVSASAYKAALIALATASNSTWDTWAEAQTNGFAEITIDGATVYLDDVLQKAPNVLEFILEVDNAGSAVPATDEINKTTWAGLGGNRDGYLRDNAIHTLTYPANLGNLILQDATGVDFIVTDAKKPFIYGVEATNQVQFQVNFSESMAEDLVEGARGALNGNFLIDGKQVWLTAVAGGADATEIANAAANNWILVRELYVGSYVADTSDTRAIVYFRLDNSDALAAGGHVIQIANVGDWAGMVDVNNVVTTQTFDFTVAADTSKPVPTLEVQSPEQWKLSWDETIVLDNNTTDAFEIFKADSSTKLVDGTDYTMTDITTAADAGTVYLIEFLDDWTVYYNTAGTAVNYWNSTKNPYQLKVMAAEVADLLGNDADAQTLTATLPIDVTSPVILSAVDKNTVDGVTPAGTKITVTMNEPVQAAVNGVTVSTVELTPSQQQIALGDGADDPANDVDEVPQPTFEFVKGDSTVEGTLTALDNEDMVFDVTPASTLASGTWILYIRNLTDDVGNAYNTQEYALIVPEGAATVTDTKIAWAAYDNASVDADGNYDYIYIKFTETMDATGAAGVSRTTNYVFNGVALPDGSQVFSGIEGITNGWDGVTIRMPRAPFKDVYDAADAEIFTAVLNVANNFKSADGDALTGPFEVELTDLGAADKSAADKDGIVANDQFESAYINATASALIGGEGVIDATASDVDGDGDIDTLTVTLFDGDGLGAAMTDDTVKITVGGKTFINEAALINATTVVFTAANAAGTADGVTAGSVATNEISGTVTTTIGITATNGGMIMAAGKVNDGAGPVVKAVTLVDSDNNGIAELQVEFTENVDDSSITIGDFAYNGQVATSLNTTVGTDTDADDQFVTLISTNGWGTGAANLVYTAGTMTDLDTDGAGPDTAFASITHTFLAAGVTDNAAPVLLTALFNDEDTDDSIIEAGETFTLTFSEDLLDSTVASDANVAYTAFTDFTLTNIDAAEVDGPTTFTVTGEVAGVVTITVTGADASNALDGNETWAVKASALTDADGNNAYTGVVLITE